MNPITYKSLVLAASLPLLLSACSSSSSSNSTPSTPTLSSTGVLLDSPVAGVSYTTSTGANGTTNDKGEFNYTVGEVVTFAIGQLEIGNYSPKSANEIVTPIQLAEAYSEADRNNVVTNLLILLQSLDEDGDPDNGITISESTINKLNEALSVEGAQLSFKLDPDSFVAETVLTSALDGKQPVTKDDALHHFKTQYFNNLAGVYYFKDYGSVLRINQNGEYIVGQFTYDESEAELGIEQGTIEIDPLTSKATFEVKLDTQGGMGAGFNGSSGDYFVPSLDGLYISTPDEDVTEHQLMRLDLGSGNSIVGAWAVATTPTAYNSSTGVYTRELIGSANYKIDTQQFIFFADGTYVMLDPVGDDEGLLDGAPAPCGGPGVEKGTYTYSSNLLTISTVSVDTNGCGGLGLGKVEITSLNNNVMVFDNPESSIPFELHRIIVTQ